MRSSKRAADALGVAADLLRRAGAGALAVAGVAAGAGVHRRDQHDVGGEGERAARRG